MAEKVKKTLEPYNEERKRKRLYRLKTIQPLRDLP